MAYLLDSLFGLLFVWSFGALGTILAIVHFFLKSDYKCPKYIILAILVFLYYLIWDIINGFIHERGGIFVYLYKSTFFHIIFILLLIENTEFDKDIIEKLFLIFKVTLFIAVIFTIIQLIYDPFFFTPPSIVQRYINRDIYNIRLSSIFGYIGTNEIGMSFIPILALTISRSIIQKERFLYVWIICGGIVAFASNSRWIQLNYVVVCTILVAYRKISLVNFLIMIFLSFSVIFLILYLAGYNLYEYSVQRLLDSSALSRLLAWKMFFRFFPENPFFGTGEHVTEELRRAILHKSSQIHIGYLSHLFEYGIIGSILILTFWYSIVRKFYRNAKETNYYGALYAFICFLVANITLVEYSIFKYGLILAFVINKYYLNTKVKPESNNFIEN